MNKKIFMLLFFLLVLMSMSAISAANLDDNNDTVVLSDDAEILSAANDVDAIGDLNGDNATDGDKALQNDAKSVAAGDNNENDLLSADNDKNGNILNAGDGDHTDRVGR